MKGIQADHDGLSFPDIGQGPLDARVRVVAVVPRRGETSVWQTRRETLLTSQ